jgi:hypothetical protein
MSWLELAARKGHKEAKPQVEAARKAKEGKPLLNREVNREVVRKVMEARKAAARTSN